MRHGRRLWSSSYMIIITFLMHRYPPKIQIQWVLQGTDYRMEGPTSVDPSLTASLQWTDHSQSFRLSWLLTCLHRFTYSGPFTTRLASAPAQEFSRDLWLPWRTRSLLFLVWIIDSLISSFYTLWYLVQVSATGRYLASHHNSIINWMIAT